MINKKDIISELRKRFPDFLINADYSEEELIYPIFGDFARYIIQKFKEDNKQELSNIFNFIETLHTDADDFIKEASTIGILEGLQNINEIEEREINIYLGKASLEYWQRLNDFWNKKRKTI